VLYLDFQKAFEVGGRILALIELANGQETASGDEGLFFQVSNL